MYPEPGLPLLPEELRPVLGSELLDDQLREDLGLPLGTTLGDLGPEIWSEHGARFARRMANGVVAAARRRHRDLIALDSQLSSEAIATLELAPRTRNALIRAGLVSGGRLQPTTVGRVLSLPAFGALSLLDLITALTVDDRNTPPARTESRDGDPCEGRRRPSPAVAAAAGRLKRKSWADDVTADDPRLGTALAALAPAASSARTAAELLVERVYTPGEARRTVGAVNRFLAEADGLQRSPLETELKQTVVALMKDERATKAVLARTGLGGQDPVTLEAAGQPIGVTRERVRQLERKLRDGIGSRAGIWTPTLERTLKRAGELLPISPADLGARLVDQGLVSGPFSIPSLMAAAELFGHEVPFSYQPHVKTLTRAGEWAPSSAIHTAAHRLVEHWGATTLADVEARVEEDGGDVDPAVLLLMVESIEDFRWLDRERGWFWIRGGRNRLLNHVEKIVAVAGSIGIGELRAGVGRHHRMKGFRPPRHVLAALCVDTGRYQREGDLIVGGKDLPDWRTVLGDNERELVDILFEHGPLMRREDLEQVAVRERGVKRTSFYVYLTYSPVLERYAPGVYGLRGASVGAAEVDALVPPRVRQQVLQDHGWTADRQVWAAFRISPAGEATGILGTPAALLKVAQGRFELATEDDRPVGTLVVEQNMWGLSPFFRRWGVEAGDYVVIRIDLATRGATVVAGDEGVLLRQQNAE